MTCDPNTLVALAARFQGSDPKMLQMAILQLLCEASAGGGGGGSISVESNGVAVVNPATAVNFLSGLSVADGGGGRADVAVSLSSGRATLAVDYEIPSATFTNVGLSVSLAAGTYMVTVPLCFLALQDVASNISAYAQLYNQTAAAAIANSEIQFVAEFVPNAAWGSIATLTNIFTLNATSTIQVQAREAFTDGGLVVILGDNQSSISYVKIG